MTLSRFESHARSPTLLGKLRMSDFLPSNAFNLQASCARRNRASVTARQVATTPARSWLYSQILSLPPARLTNSTILSRSLRLARRAGEKTTISRPCASAKHAQKMAIENVFLPARKQAVLRPAARMCACARRETRPKRRGVEMSTSLLLVSQPCDFMMAGRSVAHDER